MLEALTHRTVPPRAPHEVGGMRGSFTAGRPCTRLALGFSEPPSPAVRAFPGSGTVSPPVLGPLGHSKLALPFYFGGQLSVRNLLSRTVVQSEKARMGRHSL